MTTLTPDQLTLVRWCKANSVLVEFTTQTHAITWLRNVGREKIGKVPYRLVGGEWVPHDEWLPRGRSADTVK